MQIYKRIFYVQIFAKTFSQSASKEAHLTRSKEAIKASNNLASRLFSAIGKVLLFFYRGIGKKDFKKELLGVHRRGEKGEKITKIITTIVNLSGEPVF